jgi:hypothetical protein
MKRKLLLVLAVMNQMMQAQFTVSPNPFNANSGVLTFTYGASGNFSLFNPNGATTIYLYTGLETDGVTGTWEYHDTWADINTQIPLTLNSSGYYEGSADIGNRNYFSELTQSVGAAPDGTTVNNWYFLLRNAAGNSQSSDLLGTNYGFVPGALSAVNFENNAQIRFFDGKVFSTLTDNAKITIYNALGQNIKTITILPNVETVLDIPKNQMYVATINNSTTTKSIKFYN